MMIQCPECGKEISSEATVCPNCGAENKQAKENKSNKMQGFILGIVGVVGMVLFSITQEFILLGVGIGGIIGAIVLSNKKSK